MTILEKYKHKNWRNIAIRLALIAITVVIIVFFMPRNKGAQLRYDIGKPWMYGSFIAKFDFLYISLTRLLKPNKTLF